MADKTYLNEIALKMGVLDKKVLQKAGELLKQLGSQKGLSCSESCKTAVCIELASDLVSSTESVVPRETAVKFSGYKKGLYSAKFNIISKMLNLDKVYSVRELCVTLGISELESSAKAIFEKYKAASSEISQEDFQHPMYIAAAIMAACKCNKVKINSAKLVEASRLKKAEFEALVQKMEVFGLKKEKGAKRKIVKEDSIIAEDFTSPSSKKTKKKTEEEIEAEYQAWKKRMLMEP